jgi:type I restriction enzyme S subunit
MKAYPVYKDSRLEWIGDIPADWDSTRIKFLANGEQVSFIDGDWIESPYITDDGIRLVQTGNVGIGVYKEQGYRFVSEETFQELDCTEVFPKDVLICRLASPVGRACLAPELGVRMITSVDNCILKPSKFHDPRFIVYQLSNSRYLDYIEYVSRGSTRARISRSMLGDLGFVAPPLPEQQAIADFLDRKTSQIDTLIEKKQRQIDLLQEQRTALINHAVTKGLNPDAPMKDSSVEWLGEIPSHWEVKRIKHLAQRKKYAIKTGPFGSQLTNADMMGADVKVYNQRSIIDNDFVNGENYVSLEKFQQLKEFEIYAGDILITTRGTIGRCAIFPNNVERGILHPCLIRLQLNEEIMLKEYLIWFIQDSILFQQSIFFESNATTIDVIYSGTMKQVFVPVPPVEEQRKLIQYLLDLKNKVQLATEKLEKEIALLQEYRTALISEAVTGKIDLRTAV